MNTIPIIDMSNTFIEHSIVINNFVTTVGNQLNHLYVVCLAIV